MSKATHTPGPVETLARIAMQRDDYAKDADLRDAVDNVLGNPVYDAATDLLEALLESRSIGDRLARGIAVSKDEIRAANARQTAAIQKATGGQS